MKMRKKGTKKFKESRIIPSHNTNSPESKKNLALVFSLFFGVGATIAIFSGADASFDTLNYHLFNGWATFRSTKQDYLPTSIWTFFPSHLDFLYYQIWSIMPSAGLSTIVGGMQGLLGFFVYRTVQMFEDNESKISNKGILFGLIALSSPLIRGQFGNSMHDGSLVMLEFYVIYKYLQTRLHSTNRVPMRIPIILALILAFKPAHIVFVFLAIIVFLPHSRNIKKVLASISIFTFTYIAFSIPWWYKSFAITGTPIFPYLQIGDKDLLSGGVILHSYEEWEIHSFSKFLLNLFYPGGSPSVNHEIPFIDFTFPITFLLGLSFFILLLAKRIQIAGGADPIAIGCQLFAFAVLVFTVNQFVFTGIRYILIVYPIAVTVLGIWSTCGKNRIQEIVNVSVVTLVTLNLLLPNSVYLPNRIDPLFNSNFPDYGRTNNTFIRPIRSGFIPTYPISDKDYVLLGQEQVSFVAALWNQESNFMGLQAYILGDDAKHEMRARLSTTTARGGTIYIVALTQNLVTMKSQLEGVSVKYQISECKIVKNPYKRDISMCKVI